MPFKYSVPDHDHIIFARLGAGCGRSVFIFTGSIFTVIGLCLLIFTTDPALPMSVTRWVFPLFGLIAIYAGIVLPSIQRKTIPDEIIFDNRNGRIQINQEASEIKTAYIYYDEIDDIVMRVKKENSSSKSSRTYYTYHVYLTKRDGGQWELMRLNSEADALFEIGKLKSLIQFSALPVRVPVPSFVSKKYTVRNEFQKTELTWRNRPGYGPWALAGFAILFLSIGYAIAGTGFMEEDFPVFGMFVMGFIALIFVIVIGSNAMKMIKNANTEYAVVVSTSGLEYIERSLVGRINRSVPFVHSDIYAISFSFDSDNMMRKIYIYTHEQFQKQRNMTVSLSFESIKAMYNFYQGLVSLEIQALTPVEALVLENYLQQQLDEKGNIRVA
jgi:hypothetical protein